MRSLNITFIFCLLWVVALTSEAGGEPMSHRDYSLIDRPDVLMILFHPRRDHAPKSGNAIDVRIKVADGIQVGGRLHVARKDSPVILLFHGNGEIASDYDFIADWYTQIGITLLVVDYRGYGRSDGKPTSSALIEDAMTTYRSVGGILSEHELDAPRLFVMGRSLGSAAAIEIASKVGNEISGLIIESGFAYTFPLLERLGGLSLAEANERKNGFDNVGKIESVTVPTLILHGEEDYLIPISDGEALYRHCGSKKKEFISIPGAGHNDIIIRGKRQYFEGIRKLVMP